MKYIVSSAASLSFADGSRHELTPGIHDSFPEQVKKHWAFTHHAKPLSESDLQQEQQDGELSLRVDSLEGQVTDLQKQLEAEQSKVAELTGQRDAHAKTIDDHVATIADLQKQLEAAKVTDNAKKQPTANK
ncbi:STY1053 family phage-associated protein [Serratia sp. CY71147]|uniref:STY1053 family phage-associated protein n=1 Tax=Serratia sp. CY71147 TaxID=3383673 RepID=UPI003F9F7B22